MQKVLNYVPKWLHKFSPAAAVYKTARFSTSLPILGKVSFCILNILIGIYCYLPFVLLPISLATNNVEHLSYAYLLSTYLFAEISVQIHCQYYYVLSHSIVSDSETPWTVAQQAPLSGRFSRQEYWSGLLCHPPIIFPTGPLHCRWILYHLSQQRSPMFLWDGCFIKFC